jgi:3-hydroxybutyrate dehydrogenase
MLLSEAGGSPETETTMQVMMKERPAAAARPLSGRTALVTGSTSGIGLGVAATLAGQGAAIVLNGFGDMREIEMTRDRLRRNT